LAKLKNEHKKEILNLEREFHLSTEALRLESRLGARHELEVKRLRSELKEREDDVEELRELKRQFKQEIRNREKRI
jgi:hypothetical protein